MARQKKAWRLALALAAGLLAAPLAAPREAGADPALQGFAAGGDVRVEAENLEVDVGAQTATLLGNVTLAKGDLTVKCPRIDLKFDHVFDYKKVNFSEAISQVCPGGADVFFDNVSETLQFRPRILMIKIFPKTGWR